ncbi:Calx-beta domain-containing protein [Rhizorhabdus sp. FW153]|uniref:Calx-beta domain-containing protein n=1 Tax=Rhizorhabdus sp. FW153 TaxID=3400216 RepID=UPI003CFAF6F8
MKSSLIGALVTALLLAPSLAHAETMSYTYDALGRLTTTSASGGPANGIGTTLGFDPAGNRTAYVGTLNAPPSFSVNDAFAVEGDSQQGVLSFIVTRSVSSDTMSVSYATSNGAGGLNDSTAVAGSDYVATSGTLIFAPGESSKSISVGTVNDNMTESGEQLTLTLSAPTGGAVLQRPAAVGFIRDDDATKLGAFNLVEGQSLSSPDGRFTLVAQGDFNVVLYMGTTPLWATNTNGLGALGQFSFQGVTDGNLVLYDDTGAVRWSSNTAGNPGATFALQNDGNMVIYSTIVPTLGTILWQSGTCCH